MTREQEAGEQIRQQLEQLIDAARSEIELAIAAAERTQHEGEGSDHIDGLKAQLSTLQAQSSHIQHGSLAQLQRMQTTLPLAISSVRQTSQAIAQNANFEIGQHVVEMSIEKIQMLQEMHDQQSTNFTNYETKSANRIDQLAKAGGIDVSGYHDNRLRLKAEIEEAKRNGDRVAQFNAQAQLAANNLYGLIKAGGSEAEIEEAKAKEAEQRAILLKEKEIEALNAGKASGLSGDALRDHIDNQRRIAANELDIENVRNAQTAGLSVEQMARAGLTNTVHRAAMEVNENERTKSGSIKTAAKEPTRRAEKIEQQADESKYASLLQANGFTSPANGFDPASSDHTEAKQPDHIRDGTATIEPVAHR